MPRVYIFGKQPLVRFSLKRWWSGRRRKTYRDTCDRVKVMKRDGDEERLKRGAGKGTTTPYFAGG